MVTPQKDLLNIACDYLENHNEYENLGITWANEIKKIRADQQIHAKKAMIFCMKASWVHRHSVKINELLSNNIDFRNTTPQYYFG